MWMASAGRPRAVPFHTPLAEGHESSSMAEVGRRLGRLDWEMEHRGLSSICGTGPPRLLAHHSCQPHTSIAKPSTPEPTPLPASSYRATYATYQTYQSLTEAGPSVGRYSLQASRLPGREGTGAPVSCRLTSSSTQRLVTTLLH